MKETNSERMSCPYRISIEGERETACLFQNSFLEQCEGEIFKREECVNSTYLFEPVGVYDSFHCNALETNLPVYNRSESRKRSPSTVTLNVVSSLKTGKAESRVKDEMMAGEITKEEGVGKLVLLIVWPRPIKDSKKASEFDSEFSKRVGELALEGRLQVHDLMRRLIRQKLGIGSF